NYDSTPACRGLSSPEADRTFCPSRNLPGCSRAASGPEEGLQGEESLATPAPSVNPPPALPGSRGAGGEKRTALGFGEGRLENTSRRRPTLPRTCARSTIGAGGL